jgi:hypothetical protein
MNNQTIKALVQGAMYDLGYTKPIDRIEDVGPEILNNSQLMNSFVTQMINKVYETIVVTKLFDNPLSKFKKGAMPAGMFVEHAHINPAKAHEYESSGKDPNKKEISPFLADDPDIAILYYSQNSTQRFDVQVNEPMLVKAFTSWESMGSFVEGIVSSLYNGEKIFEFEQTKNLIGQDFSRDESCAICLELPSETDYDYSTELTETLRATGIMMGFPSTEYNNYSAYAKTLVPPTGKTINSTPRVTFTEGSALNLLILADIASKIDVEVLANAFNIDKATWLGSTTYLNDFGSCEKDDTDINDLVIGTKYHSTGKSGVFFVKENDNKIYKYSLKAVLCDDAFLQVRDTLNRTESVYNGKTLENNYFRHLWQSYSLCSFANGVYLYNRTEVDTLE